MPKCASLAYVNTAHNDGLLAEVDIADGEALVDEFERPAGRRLALLLLAHMHMIISSPCTETSYLVRTLTTLIIEHPRVPQAEVATKKVDLSSSSTLLQLCFEVICSQPLLLR